MYIRFDILYFNDSFIGFKKDWGNIISPVKWNFSKINIVFNSEQTKSIDWGLCDDNFGV